jgi:hypothetical protein
MLPGMDSGENVGEWQGLPAIFQYENGFVALRGLQRVAAKGGVQPAWFFGEKLESDFFEDRFPVPVEVGGTRLLNDPAVISWMDELASFKVEAVCVVEGMEKAVTTQYWRGARARDERS